MCIVFALVKRLPGYPLVLLFNRDEDFDRPAREAHFWEDLPQILAGRDLKRGGTWAGISRSGKIAALTNVRERHPDGPSPLSRGRLAVNFLTGDDAPEDYLSSVGSDDARYFGYNLLVGDANALFHYSNRSQKVTRLEAGIHGLSNADLNTPWPKIERGKSVLAGLCERGEVTADALFEVMCNPSPAKDELLPETGVGFEWERMLSPIFIRTPDYGTRLTSLVFFHEDESILFYERTYSTVGERDSNVFYRLSPQPNA